MDNQALIIAMPAIYLIEQGAKLRKASRRLVVEKDGIILLDVPAYQVDQVLVFGAVQISTQALSFLLDSGIGVSFLSMNGRLKGRLAPAESKNVFLRLAHYERSRDTEFRLRMARSILEAKIKNQRTLILRYRRNHPDADFSDELGRITGSLSSLAHKKAIPAMLGIEGASTGTYFQCYARMLTQGLTFQKRTRHPPLDPVNALLSLGYVMITNEIASLVESLGLDPAIGFLHGLRYGRQSLALDLVEEFRHPVIDGLVLTLANNMTVRESDFQRGSDGACFLNKEAFTKFLGLYQDRIERPFLDREGNSYTTYRKLFRRQVEQMVKAVLNREEYKGFLER